MDEKIRHPKKMNRCRRNASRLSRPDESRSGAEPVAEAGAEPAAEEQGAGEDLAVREDPAIEGRGGREHLAGREQTGEDPAARENDTGEGLVGNDVRAILGDGQGGPWTDRVIGFLEMRGKLDSRAVTLEELYDLLSEALRAAGTPEAMIYAMRRTGLFLVAGYEHLMTDAEIDAWYAAVEDYETEVN